MHEKDKAVPVYSVLFVCSGNSARSIMAEALVTTLGKGRFVGYSAGCKPAGAVNRFAIEMVKRTGYPLQKLRSKSWHEFAGGDAPRMDFVVTLCRGAAAEDVPRWPGHPATAYWEYDDPAAISGTDPEKREIFERSFLDISERIRRFVRLSPAALGIFSGRHD